MINIREHGETYSYHDENCDLRNHFTRISAWIEHGEAVEITKGGKAFARLVRRLRLCRAIL